MLRCGTAVITVLACCSTALRLPHRAQTSHRARTPQPVASGFDWGAREIKRMSLMVHADEPLEAELQGLGAIGGAAGLMVGPRLLGSGVLGFILGAQLAPTLGFVEGPRGDGFRAAGWRMAVCIDRTARRTRSTWEALSEAIERSVFNKLVQQAWAHSRNSTSRRARAYVSGCSAGVPGGRPVQRGVAARLIGNRAACPRGRPRSGDGRGCRSVSPTSRIGRCSTRAYLSCAHVKSGGEGRTLRPDETAFSDDYGWVRL